MEGRLILCWVVVLCMAMATCNGYYSDTKPYATPKEQITKLHFFLQETLSGKTPSAILVAHRNVTTAFNNTPFSFGSVYATDSPITAGPNLTSEVIGNAQGLYASTGQHVLTLVVYVDIGFTQGKFNGSSISLFSRNPITETTKHELAVVGGRGKFRMAKGFALLNTLSFDVKTGDVVVEYDVTVIHY